MQRDKQYLHSILEQIEGGTTQFNTLTVGSAKALLLEEGDGNPDGERLRYHLKLAEEDGLIKIRFKSTDGQVFVEGLTSRGHDYLERGRS